MIIAVTGISSGLGRALVPKLQKDPSVERIIGIDVNDYPGNGDKITFINTDIRNKAQVESALEDVDVLFHMAFIVSQNRLPNLKTIYDININGSKTVFNAAAKNKVQKIIYISSVSAYGHCPESLKVVTEDSPLLGAKTTNFYYSYTKAIVEQFLDRFEKDHPDIALIRVRPPIFSRPDAFANLIEHSREKKTSSKAIFPLNQDGKMPMQLIHENDLTDILLLMLKKDVRGAYNVASPPLPDLCRFFQDEYNHEFKPAAYLIYNLFLSMHKIWPKVGWIQGWKYISILNTEKVEKEFNWKPKETTEDILRAALDS